MAYYNYELPQTAQSVNVGQFGPSHDSLQDWRSVEQTARYVERLVAELEALKQEVETLKQEAGSATTIAINAATVAAEVNEKTIDTIENTWVAAEELAAEVNSDKVEVEKYLDSVAESVKVVSEDSRKAYNSSEEAAKSLARVESIGNSIINMKAHAYSLPASSEASASYDAVTSTLEFGIPTIVSSAPGTGVTGIWKEAEDDGTDAGYRQGDVRLRALDVGAIPMDGSAKITEPFEMQIKDTNHEFRIAAEQYDGLASFSVLYSPGDAIIPRRGITLDGDGNTYIGKDLYVQHENSRTPIQVYHPLNKPNPTDIGAASIETTYTKEESDERFLGKDKDAYTKDEMDKLLKEKLRTGPTDGGVYAWFSSGWNRISPSMMQHNQDMALIHTNKKGVKDLDDRVSTLESAVKPHEAEVVWYGNESSPAYQLEYNGIYTVIVSRDKNTTQMGSCTMVHRVRPGYEMAVVTGPNTVIQVSVAGDRIVMPRGVVREIIKH